MGQRIIIARGGKVIGTYDLTYNEAGQPLLSGTPGQLLLSSGALNDTDWHWHESMPGWLPLYNLLSPPRRLGISPASGYVGRRYPWIPGAE